MGEHTEITAKEWNISRDAQDQVALESHRNSIAAWDRGFFTVTAECLRCGTAP